MNRIEAINAMLDGKKVRHSSSSEGNYMYFDKEDQRFFYYYACRKGIVGIDDALNYATGYYLYEEPKPEEEITVVINGKTYKLVEE